MGLNPAAAAAPIDTEKIPVGYVTAEALAVVRRNALPFGLLALALTLPGVVLSTVLLDAGLALTATIDAATLLSSGVEIAATFLLLGAVTYGVFQDMRGETPTAGACVGRGLQYMVAAVPAALLVAVILYAGAALLLVPGLVGAVLLYVAVPAQVVERPGTQAALRRSMALTRGNRLAILGLVAIALLVAGAGSMLNELTVSAGALGFLLQWLVTAAVSLYWSVLAAVTYHALRDAAAGPTENLTAVFD